MRSASTSQKQRRPGGEGEGVLHDLLGAPTQITEALTARGLLAVSLLLAALLVSMAATALTP
ncbi:hypothetical protein [Actinoplanes sp. NPDC049265]|uniref:hypothetical protein n=1 Tax=Actinoplanes sp. NPDC049265 TaxID=3363902 RepID=UPI003723D790